MKHVRAAGVLAVVALSGGAIACYLGWLPNPLAGRVDTLAAGSSPDGPGGADSGVVRIMGWMEPAGGVIDLGGIPGDRLERLAVAEGEAVEKGQVLAGLDSRALKQQQVDLLAIQIAEAAARRDAESQLAESRIRTAKLGQDKVKLQDLQVESLQEKIGLLADNLALAQKDLGRLTNLRASPQPSGLSDEIVSQQDLERQQLVAHRAKTELDAAKAELRSLQETRDLSAKAAEADYAAAVASKSEAVAAIPVKSLQQRLEMAKADLALAEIKAPCKGTVLKIFVRAGESIAQKPILCMADLERMVALAEVYEVDARRVARGQTAIIRSPAFHPPHDEKGLRGKVVAVGRMVNTPELKSLDPFARVDRHVIPIRIELDKEGSAEAARFVNLQVDVELHTAEK
ncbi:MAG: efflux RND transporter periplasmic adaptor subunit [Thermoguttaceae bacterium]